MSTTADDAGLLLAAALLAAALPVALALVALLATELLAAALLAAALLAPRTTGRPHCSRRRCWWLRRSRPATTWCCRLIRYSNYKRPVLRRAASRRPRRAVRRVDRAATRMRM